MENRKLKSLPSRKGKGRQKDLPLENILDILKQSAWSTGTKNARNMCLICKAAYDECWPALHRIVALRSAASLQKYSRRLVEGGKRESSEQLRERQAALESLYINNTPKDAQTYPGSASCLTMILTVARNVRFCHFEEHWSNTSSWVRKEKTTAVRLIKNPLRHVACFPATIGKIADNGSNTTFAQLPPKETRKPEDWVHLVPKLTELTLSAHTIDYQYLELFGLMPVHWGPDTPGEMVPEEVRKGANFEAFSNLTHLHLYFADLDNLDNLLFNVLMQLPKLTHLRLSRPTTCFESRYDLEGETAYLSDISYNVVGLLQERGNCEKMKSIIFQVGSNFDRRVLYHMMSRMMLERRDPRFRLIYTKENDKSHTIPYQYDPGVDSEESDGYDSDIPLARVGMIKAKPKRYFFIDNTKADTDAKCEKLAFYQFAKRAGGAEGVWSKKCMTLW